jgi:pantothenate kinase
MKYKYWIVAGVIVFVIILAAILLLQKDYAPKNVISGDKDIHGCLTPAGYSYNDEIKACIRSLEINDTDRINAAKIAVEYLSNVKNAEGKAVYQNFTIIEVKGGTSDKYQEYAVTISIQGTEIEEVYVSNGVAGIMTGDV